MKKKDGREDMSESKDKTNRLTWRGLYPRKTKTKKEKIESSERKHRKDLTRDY